MRAGLRSQRGVALIEVLIALLVIGVGSIAVARLMALGFSEGGSGKARALAGQIAREKLDDLREFSQLDAGGAGVFGYDEIASDSGGVENEDGSAKLSAGAVTQSDTEYRRSWSATPYSFCDENVPAILAPCVLPKARPDFKQVIIEVEWTDASGEARTLMLESAIAAVEPGLAVNALIPAAAAAKPAFAAVPAPP